MGNTNNRKNNGSSLMFVIIAVAFIGILITIMLRITFVNVNIKVLDRNAKRTFYSAEQVMDEVDIALENFSGEAMSAAYVDLLSNYTTAAMSQSSQASVQIKFAHDYLNHLVEALSDHRSSISSDHTLRGAKYEIGKITGKMSALLSEVDASTKKSWDCVSVAPKMEPTMELVFDERADGEHSLTLKNLRVDYEDENGNSTYITTDIKLTVPNLSFESGNIYPEFTKYSIIGDDEVTSSVTCVNTKVNGSIYAGHKGMNITGNNGDSNPTLSVLGAGTRVVTRGDVNVKQGAALELGDQNNYIDVWAENIKTTSGSVRGSESPAKLTAYAENYVHDDLQLESPYSLVAFKGGKYMGYTFNKDNSIRTKMVNHAAESSAIILDGRHSSLFMGDALQSILIGGRAFISRNNPGLADISSNNTSAGDILMGQAVSVKCDQKFYMIADEYLPEGMSNPMTKSAYEAKLQENGYSVSGEKVPLTASAYKSLKSYLNTKEPVTTYVISLSGTDTTGNSAMVYMYYNFKSQAKADRFYVEKCDKTEMVDRIVASDYLKFDGDFVGLDIRISDNLALLADSNVTSIIKEEGKVKHRASNVEPLSGDQQALEMANSIMYACKYRSFQETLTENKWSNYSQYVDENGSDAFDLAASEKDKNTIFESLMQKDNAEYSFVEEASSNSEANGFYAFEKPSGNCKIKVVPVDVGTSNKSYAIFVAQLTEGNLASPVNLSEVLEKASEIAGYPVERSGDTTSLLVANCSIDIDRNFKGTIISDTVANLMGSSNQLVSDSAGLQQMFSAQKVFELSGSADSSNKFLKYFQCFQDLSALDSSSDETVDISRYLKHVKWKKNED